MANPALELKEIFDGWKATNTGNSPMQTQRGATNAEGLATIRLAFELVSKLESELSKLETLGIAPASGRQTLNFCTQRVVGFPGAWHSRPDTNQQFPEHQLHLLESLGVIIGMHNGGTIGVEPDRIEELLTQIEQALVEAPLPEVLDAYIRRLIAEIRGALEKSDAFTSAAIAEQLFQLAIATKAGEAATENSEKKHWWSKIWPSFFSSTASTLTVEGTKAIFRALPM